MWRALVAQDWYNNYYGVRVYVSANPSMSTPMDVPVEDNTVPLINDSNSSVQQSINTNNMMYEEGNEDKSEPTYEVRIQKRNIDLLYASKDDLLDIPGIDYDLAAFILTSRNNWKTFTEAIRSSKAFFQMMTKDIQYDVGLLRRNELELSFNQKKLGDPFLRKLERKLFKSSLNEWKRPNFRYEIMITVLVAFISKKTKDYLGKETMKNDKSSEHVKFAKYVKKFKKDRKRSIDQMIINI